MNTSNKESKEEMIQCVEHLLKKGIHCYGVHMPFSIKYIARYLVANGCRIYIGPKRRKWIDKEKNK